MRFGTTAFNRIAPRIALAAVLLSAMAGAGAAQDAAATQARQTAHQYKEKYLQCLADESVRVLPQRMDAQEFTVFIKGRCLDELKQFRVALIDYILALKHPELDMQKHFTATNQIVAHAIDDAAGNYIGQIRARP